VKYLPADIPNDCQRGPIDCQRTGIGRTKMNFRRINSEKSLPKVAARGKAKRRDEGMAPSLISPYAA
jgi:hypothetical protein